MERPNEAGDTAVILAGGLGTRLGTLTDDIPKPMVPVGGRPFVEYIVHQLRRSGFGTIVFATGYRSDRLRRHFGVGDGFGVRIRYSEEERPLGTGGALREAAGLVAGDRFLVLNGDSFLDAAVRRLLDALDGDIIMSMALTRVADGARYGSVEQAKDGSVVRFASTGVAGPALINAGVYGVSKAVIDRISRPGPSSLEHEVLPGLAGPRLRGVAFDGFFVDIGTPDSYRALVADPAPLLRAVDMAAIV